MGLTDVGSERKNMRVENSRSIGFPWMQAQHHLRMMDVRCNHPESQPKLLGLSGADFAGEHQRPSCEMHRS